MKFTKMHGIGNDYVYVNGFEESVADPAALARVISDRHFGVGGDGLILILPSHVADVRMRMFNADGSEAEMCGNGVRCVAKYAFDHGVSKSNPMHVETGNGVLTLSLVVNDGKVSQATVKMGEPILEAGRIPVVIPGLAPDARVVDYSIEKIGDFVPMEAWSAKGFDPRITCVSMGNPHVVIWSERNRPPRLDTIGPFIEQHAIFPRRVNVHFVEVVSKGEVIMRTWERGSGVTLACGTGACAVCVAGVLTNRTGREALAHLPGGDLRLEWRESDNNVYMTGPATEVFTGEWV